MKIKKYEPTTEIGYNSFKLLKKKSSIFSPTLTQYHPCGVYHQPVLEGTQ